jgi:hypothetical protein
MEAAAGYELAAATDLRQRNPDPRVDLRAGSDNWPRATRSESLRQGDFGYIGPCYASVYRILPNTSRPASGLPARRVDKYELRPKSLVP